MDQIFPSPVDDVDPADVLNSEHRPAQGNSPWIMCNMISSLDGGIAVEGLSGGLGGPADKAVFSAIRSLADIIIVAAGTAIAENYRKPQTPVALQEARVARGQAPLPRIAIVTNSLSIDADHRVFDPEARPLIITSKTSPEEKRAALSEVADVLIAGDTTVDLQYALGQLADQGAQCVLLEGGPTLNGAFVAADLIDEWCLSVSPLIVGGNAGRVVKSNHTQPPQAFRLARTLHEDGFLFHRYLRDRSTTTDRGETSNP